MVLLPEESGGSEYCWCREAATNWFDEAAGVCMCVPAQPLIACCNASRERAVEKVQCLTGLDVLLKVDISCFYRAARQTQCLLC